MAPRGSRALGSQTQPNSSDEQQQLARARYPRQCKAPAASTPASLSFPQVQQEQRRGSKKKTKTAPSSLPAPSPSAPTDSSQTWANMTVVQLKIELRKRKLPVSGLKAQLVARLEAEDTPKAAELVQAAPPAADPLGQSGEDAAPMSDHVQGESIDQPPSAAMETSAQVDGSAAAQIAEAVAPAAVPTAGVALESAGSSSSNSTASQEESASNTNNTPSAEEPPLVQDVQALVNAELEAHDDEPQHVQIYAANKNKDQLYLVLRVLLGVTLGLVNLPVVTVLIAAGWCFIGVDYMVALLPSAATLSEGLKASIRAVADAGLHSTVAISDFIVAIINICTFVIIEAARPAVGVVRDVFDLAMACIVLPCMVVVGVVMASVRALVVTAAALKVALRIIQAALVFFYIYMLLPTFGALKTGITATAAAWPIKTLQDVQDLSEAVTKIALTCTFTPLLLAIAAGLFTGCMVQRATVAAWTVITPRLVEVTIEAAQLIRRAVLALTPSPAARMAAYQAVRLAVDESAVFLLTLCFYSAFILVRTAIILVRVILVAAIGSWVYILWPLLMGVWTCLVKLWDFISPTPPPEPQPMPTPNTFSYTNSYAYSPIPSTNFGPMSPDAVPVADVLPRAQQYAYTAPRPPPAQARQQQANGPVPGTWAYDEAEWRKDDQAVEILQAVLDGRDVSGITLFERCQLRKIAVELLNLQQSAAAPYDGQPMDTYSATREKYLVHRARGWAGLNPTRPSAYLQL